MDSKTFSKLIDTQIERYRKLLPNHISTEKFVTSAKTFYVDSLAKDKHDKLVNASEKSIMVAVEKAAKEGLLMDGNEACWMTFGSEAQYSPMVWGLMKLIQNSGCVSKVSVHVVWSNETFEIEIVNGEDQMKHKPLVFATEKEKGERVGVYAAAKLTDGNVLIKYLGKEKIMKLRSKSKNQKLWDQEADEFWCKSALRQISKFLPRSSEEMKAVTNHLDSDIVGDVDNQDQVPQAEHSEELLSDEQYDQNYDLRQQAESFRDRESLRTWFETDLNPSERKQVSTWITEVLQKLPKQEPVVKDEHIASEQNKNISKRLSAAVEEDDLEPAEEGDAF